MFSGFGVAVEPKWMRELGLRAFNAGNPGRLSVQWRDPAFMGFESDPTPERGQEVPVSLQPGAGRSLLRLSDARGNQYDAAALTSWGGYVLAPFAVVGVSGQDGSRWVVDPIAFLKQALDLPPLPVPDVTTEGGRRILMAHIDGDGFASRAERSGGPFASEVLLNEFLERYRIPTTVSVIEGEVGGHGLFPALAPQLESIARRMFALPHVEAASHSFSHPFDWADAMANKPRPGAPDASYNLQLTGYSFDLTREIKGSLDYINTRLMPPGKRASVFLWSGDCVPPAAAIAETERHQALNMNGGDTLITESNKSLTAIASHGIRKSGHYQVFAPNQNENIYTNKWQGPYYGFERVIETFRLTETPVRYKPIDIYYHTYAASKPASIAALHKVYRWALGQPVTPLYASQYIRKVLDFEQSTLARDLATGELILRTGADLRTLRLPRGAVMPSLSKSSGLAGIAPGPSADYLILSAAQTRLVMVPDPQPVVHLQQANGMISDFERGGATDIRFTLASNVTPAFSLAHASACNVTANGKRLVGKAEAGADPAIRYAIPEPAAGARQRIEVNCRS
jgi:hypothetical protein